MGFSPASALPWEFATHCRPGLQPFIAYCVAKSLYTLGLYNPFTVAFLLRLFTGILSWWVTCRLVLQLLPEFITERGKQVFAWCALLLWFVPYMGVRFSSENFSAILFLLACSILLQIQQQDFSESKRSLLLIAAGLLLGFSFSVRLQIAFALAGVAIWILFIQKWKWTTWLPIVFFSVIAIGISALADRWLYGSWVFTPYNYYYVNIVQHAAAKFGVSPPWWYIPRLIQAAVPPISIVLIVVFFYGVKSKPWHLFTLACILFVIGHCAIGHKEMRFLFPMVFPFVFLASIGVDRLITQLRSRKIYTSGWNILAAMNIALLIYKAFTPAEESVRYYAFLYKALSQPNTVIINDPYYISGLHSRFYRPANAQVIIPDSSSNISNIIAGESGKKIYYFSQSINPEVNTGNYKLKKAYCLLPGWLLKFNINDWQSRSNIWMIYTVQQ